jgi:hypothetical protein
VRLGLALGLSPRWPVPRSLDVYYKNEIYNTCLIPPVVTLCPVDGRYSYSIIEHESGILPLPFKWQAWRVSL